MALNMNAMIVGSENPAALVDFYTKVLGKPGMDEGGWAGWQVGDGWLGIGPHDQVKGKNTAPGRLMTGFMTADVQGEFERIKGLGAEVVAEPYHPGPSPDMWVATFADPDGNYFQLASPMPSS